MREIEILFRVDEPIDDLIRRFRHLGHRGTQRIIDIYFTHPGMPQLDPIDYEIFESFRLRQKGPKTMLTWKHNHMKNGQYLYADEEEIAVEGFEPALRLLRSLGFKELVRIDNERTTFETDDYEIVVDNVNGLGILMEIEHRRPEARAAEEIVQEMHAFLKELGVTSIEELHLGKPELMLQRMERD